MSEELLTKELNAILDNLINFIQNKKVVKGMDTLHKSLRQKYTPKTLAKTPLFSDPLALYGIIKLKGGQWVIEDDKALLIRDNCRLLVLMKKESNSWKFAGFAKKMLKLPQKSKGYRLTEDSLRLYTPEIRKTLNDILNFHKKVFRAIQSKDIETLQNIFITLRSQSRYHFENSSLIKYYLNNIQREINRPIECIRFHESEATIDYKDSTLVWHLIVMKGIWYIRRITDFAAADFKLSEMPTFYFKKQ